MKLRERQKQFVNRSIKALNTEGNSLGIAPTGAGKTVMMAAILGRGSGQCDVKPVWEDGKALVIQHREELVGQNKKTFGLMNPDKRASVVTAHIRDWSGDAMFGMVQTVANRVEEMPELSVLAIDEAHHSVAASYRKIIEAAYKKNPELRLLGVTATPTRGDKHGLRTVFSNVSDQITITELVKAGHLVRPRCYAPDLGIAGQVTSVRKMSSGEYDPDAVAAIMDKRVLNERIIEEWAALAGNRQTVVFCATVKHAEHLAELWRERGYTAAHINGDMDGFKRKQILDAYDRGEIQVLTNVMVLTEGWDHQPTSCVVLTRPLSFKGLMLQMIGRGLRKVDPDKYPGVRKDDCIVLDFGATLLAHGDLETAVTLSDDDVKNCHECDAVVPHQAKECPLCGAIFEDPEQGTEPRTKSIFAPAEKETIEAFSMTEISLLDASPFRWENFFDGRVTVCNAGDAWSAIVNYDTRWWVIAGRREDNLYKSSMIGDTDDYCVALATADDYMRQYGDTERSHKAKRWMRQKPTAKQGDFLQKKGYSFGDVIAMNRYRAACAMTWELHSAGIKARVLSATQRAAA